MWCLTWARLDCGRLAGSGVVPPVNSLCWPPELGVSSPSESLRSLPIPRSQMIMMSIILIVVMINNRYNADYFIIITSITT